MRGQRRGERAVYNGADGHAVGTLVRWALAEIEGTRAGARARTDFGDQGDAQAPPRLGERAGTSHAVDDARRDDRDRRVGRDRSAPEGEPADAGGARRAFDGGVLAPSGRDVEPTDRTTTHRGRREGGAGTAEEVDARPHIERLAGASSLTLRVRLGEIDWVVKQSRSHRAFVQERDALLALAQSLGGCVPRLLATDEGLRFVAMSWVPGRSPGRAKPQAWAALGSLLARLHGVPGEARTGARDLTELAGHWRRRRRAWAALVADGAVGDAAQRRRVAAALERLCDETRPDLVAPVWCHRDLRASNVRVDDRGVPCLIDFEHARPDQPGVDLAALVLRDDELDPDDLAACLGAYRAGSHFDAAAMEPRMRQVGWFCLYRAVQSLAWAVEHADRHALDMAHRDLERALSVEDRRAG